jgi:hypothetical protein
VIVNPATDNYVQKIAVAGLNLKAGDVLHYRIRATDKSGNEGSFPATDFINTTVVSFASSVDQIVDDFTSTSSAFVGNFFNVSQPTAFTSSGMNTNHPYDVGLGPDSTSNFSFLTKTPVKVTSLNPMIYYEDVALVEYHAANVKDYVVVEASKDGMTWEQLVEPYTATAVNQWRIVFDNNGNGSQALVQPHYVRITEGGKFADGDIILIRFRLFSDKEKAGWGWFVDNLSIQGPITGVEPTVTTEFEAWPNPVANGPLYVKMMLPQASDVNVEILTMQGQLLSSERFSAPSGESEREYQASNWANGFYVVKVRSDFGTAIKKIIKLNSQN